MCSNPSINNFIVISYPAGHYILQQVLYSINSVVGLQCSLVGCTRTAQHATCGTFSVLTVWSGGGPRHHMALYVVRVFLCSPNTMAVPGA